MKGTIRYIAYSVIYTDRIHANALCRLRFMAIKAVAKPDYWPGHHNMQISLLAASGRIRQSV